MAASLAEADRMIDLARRAGLVLQIGHLERFNPALLALGGVLNQPLFIESHRIAAFGPRGLEVSVVLDLMIHDIDIILNIVKSPVTAIRPTGLSVLSGEVDIAHARLEFASGCVANVTASRVSREPLRKIRVFQRDGYISIDYLCRKVAVCRREGDPEGFRIATEDLCFDSEDMLLMEIQAFVQAVREGTPAAVTGRTGVPHWRWRSPSPRPSGTRRPRSGRAASGYRRSRSSPVDGRNRGPIVLIVYMARFPVPSIP